MQRKYKIHQYGLAIAAFSTFNALMLHENLKPPKQTFYYVVFHTRQTYLMFDYTYGLR